MKKYTLFLVPFLALLCLENLTAQNINLDVEGEVKILGKIDLSASSTDLSSLFIGKFAGLNNDATSKNNTGVGFNALRDITTGENNTSIGLSSLLQNEDGNDNVALGHFALSNNPSGDANTAIGSNALGFGTQFNRNTAVGMEALFFSETGSFNTAIGYQSMRNNTSGASNAAIGLLSLQNNTTGTHNTAIGNNALETNTTGVLNTALGISADVGSGNLTNAIAIGAFTRVDCDYCAVIGGTGTEAVKLGLGRTNPQYTLDMLGELYVTEENGIATFNSTTVNSFISLRNNSGNATSLGYFNDGSGNFFFIDTPSSNFGDFVVSGIGLVGIGTTAPSYKLEVNGTAGKPGGGSWLNSSDIRLKTDIQSFSQGLDVIEAVRPISYHYNGKLGYDTEPEYVGVIAQELQKIAPFMVSEFEGEDGENYLAVDPSAFDFILINAVKELSTEVEALKEENQRLQAMENELVQIKQLLKKIDLNNNPTLTAKKR